MNRLFATVFTVFFCFSYALGVETILIVNTTDISSGGNYTVEAKGTTLTYAPGGTNEISITDLGASDEIIITVPPIDDGNPLKIVFNIVAGEIVNLRARVIYSGHSEDAYFSNEEFVQSSGTTITIFSTDQREVVENKLYLSLEDGLVFSPNGDDSYDVLFLVMEEDFDVRSINITALNGTSVFTSVHKDFVWNGTIDDVLVDPGVYNYSILIGTDTIQGQFLIQY